MKLTNFQLILVGGFVFLLLVGVVVFSGVLPIGKSGKTTASGTVVLWGTLDSRDLGPLLHDFAIKNNTFTLTYVEKDPATYANDLIEAFASGSGPDMFFMPQDMIWRFGDKALHIPFTSIPQRTFQDTYISLASLYVDTDGFLALPFLVDPMVMYWNRDLYGNAGIVSPPKTWQDFETDVPLLTVKKDNITLSQSALALGSFGNIAHAKDVISLLLMQAGNPITFRSGSDLLVALGDPSSNAYIAAGTSAVSFYAAFSDPIKAVYSWNGGLPLDRDAFVGGTLATYFGYASELPAIRRQNPNLNFDVALVPQTAGSVARATIGNITGIAISKSSKNPYTALTAASLLTGPDFLGTFLATSAATFPVPPVRKDLLAVKPSDPYLSIFYTAALGAKNWIDPSAPETTIIFHDMISDAISNLLSVEASISKAGTRLNAVARK